MWNDFNLAELGVNNFISTRVLFYVLTPKKIEIISWPKLWTYKPTHDLIAKKILENNYSLNKKTSTTKVV